VNQSSTKKTKTREALLWEQLTVHEANTEAQIVERSEETEIWRRPWTWNGHQVVETQLAKLDPEPAHLFEARSI
jgi:hypothetical protein